MAPALVLDIKMHGLQLKQLIEAFHGVSSGRIMNMVMTRLPNLYSPVLKPEAPDQELILSRPCMELMYSQTGWIVDKWAQQVHLKPYIALAKMV